MLSALLLAAWAPTDPLHVEGTRLVESGQTVQLRGVTIPSLESSNVGEHVFRSCRVAMEDWKANCVRLPVSQDRWFGKAPDQRGNGEAYRNALDEIVTYVTRSNGFLILSLAWSNAGNWGQNLGPHRMPDENSVAFWKEAARKYRGNGRVLFELFESTPTDLSGLAWLHGGPTQEGTLSYQGYGLPDLMVAARKTGAKNVVIVSAPDSAGSVVDADGRGVLYERRLGDLGQGNLAYIVDALNSSEAPQKLREVSGKGLSWTAGTMTSSGDSSLVSDWTYTPTPWGNAVKAALVSVG